jgi:polar amino acid transport system substrate-binding protein
MEIRFTFDGTGEEAEIMTTSAVPIRRTGTRPSRARAIAATATAIVVLVALAGCGSNSSNSTTSDTLQQVLKNGTVRVADCISFAPFGFYDAAGAAQGYDVDIANLMAQQLGVKLDLSDTSADNRIPNLQTGKVDVVICNFTENPTRAKQINFTSPYVIAGEVLLVQKTSSINGIADLAGKTVAVVTGSTNAQIITAANPNAKSQSYPTSAAAVLAVKSGQADAMIEDSNFLTYQAKLDPTLRVTHDSLVPLEYNGFGVAQGQLDWVAWQNQFIQWLNTSGQNRALYKKWFGVDPAFPLPNE